MPSHRLQRLSPAKVLLIILVLVVVGKHIFCRQDGEKYRRGLGNLKDLQKLLGHSDLKTTQYLHADDEQIKNTVEKMEK